MFSSEMAPRDNIAKLIARAQAETDPDVLERIASRLFDALMDRVRHLRNSPESRSLRPVLKRGTGNGS